MATFDFSDLVDSFATEGGDSGNAVLPIARDGGATFAQGIGENVGWTAGTIDVAAVFPLNPRELEALPEGVRERGAIKVYTREPLYGVRWGADAADGRRGDVVEWRGAIWQCTEINDYGSGGAFWESVAVRMDRPAGTVADFVLEEAAS